MASSLEPPRTQGDPVIALNDTGSCWRIFSKEMTSAEMHVSSIIRATVLIHSLGDTEGEELERYCNNPSER